MVKRSCAYALGLLSPCLGVGAIALGVAAVVLVSVYPPLVRNQVVERVTVEPGHATYEELKKPTPPLFKSVFFFNLTNPEGFEAGEKPNLTQIGPYSYRYYGSGELHVSGGSLDFPSREQRRKTFINAFNDGTELSYNQTKTFLFQANASGPGLNETDRICTVNLPLVAAVAEVEAITSTVKRDAGRLILKDIFGDVGARLYMCQNATNLVWNFTDSLVHELHTKWELVLAGMNYPRDWVSIQVNNSQNDSNPSIIYTGVGDINRIGQFVQWDGHYRKLDTWPNGRGANDINGTEGLFFRPNLIEEEPLEAFVDDILRSFPLQWSGTVEHLGIRAFRYKLPSSVFESAFINPENSRWGSWCPSGLFYLGPTQWPVVPVFGSNPHFLGGDPVLREKVVGMHPIPGLHETAIDVEPVTGANVQFKRQLQINIQVNQSSHFSQLQKVNGTLYYPIMYINEQANLTADFKNYLESKGLSEVSLLSWLVWVIFALLLLGSLTCGVCTLCSFGVFWDSVGKGSRSEGTPLLDASQ